MTDGRAIAYSEREREFTFANKIYDLEKTKINKLTVSLSIYRIPVPTQQK